MKDQRYNLQGLKVSSSEVSGDGHGRRCSGRRMRKIMKFLHLPEIEILHVTYQMKYYTKTYILKNIVDIKFENLIFNFHNY